MPAENLNAALQKLVGKNKGNVDKFPMTIRGDYHRSNLHNAHSQPSVRRKDDPRLLLSNDDFTQHTSVKPLLSDLSTQPAAIKSFKTGKGSDKMTNFFIKPQSKPPAGARLKQLE